MNKCEMFKFWKLFHFKTVNFFSLYSHSEVDLLVYFWSRFLLQNPSLRHRWLEIPLQDFVVESIIYCSIIYCKRHYHHDETWWQNICYAVGKLCFYWVTGNCVKVCREAYGTKWMAIWDENLSENAKDWLFTLWWFNDPKRTKLQWNQSIFMCYNIGNSKYRHKKNLYSVEFQIHLQRATGTKH